ncbi:MAG: mycothiol biosynthesis protein [Microbacteriaceae bacterium]|jgi:N-acetyl-1-D-myo-inositol-2-amino-2-deoxy-alpha-D-glucopyranoside deacetylase|nr:mycothiol biosynthesis protein [Microbacteriaceae bacterium]
MPFTTQATDPTDPTDPTGPAAATADGADAAERVLFVHAHPDDESITTGGTIATLVDSGVHVTVLTCTRGELGEVIPADLQHLLQSPEALGAYRQTELAAAMAALGVTDQRYLGDDDARWVDLSPRRYLDSGMRWGDSGAEAVASLGAESLSAAGLSNVAADVAAVIAHVKPTAVVSYDARGGYGHPDHVRAREASRRAAEVMGVPFFEIVPDAAGPIAIDVSAVAQRKRAALAAHRSQLTIDGDSFALSNGSVHPIDLVETYRRVPVARDEEPLPFRDQSLGTKGVAAVIALCFGAIVGALMTAVHQSTTPVGGIAVPWGLVLGLVAVVGLVVGLRIVTSGRLLPILATVGIMGVTAFLASPTLGGSVIVPANTAGYVWTFAPAVVVLVVVAWPNLSRRPSPAVNAQHDRG